MFSQYKKPVLQILFLVVLVYVLAAIFGVVEGFSVRGPNVRLAAGKRSHKGPRLPGDALLPAAPWADTGMLSTFMPSSGDTPLTGIQTRLP